MGPDETRAGLDGDARLAELAEEGLEVRGLGALDGDVAAGDGAGDEVGADLDAVGDDGMVAAAEARDAFDDDRGGALARDAGAHLGEQRAEVDDLGFAGGGEDAGDAGRERRGHHEVGGAQHGAAHRAAHVDVGAAGRRGVDAHEAAFGGHRAAERLEAAQVEVDRARPDDAAAGDRHLGPP